MSIAALSMTTATFNTSTVVVSVHGVQQKVNLNIYTSVGNIRGAI